MNCTILTTLVLTDVKQRLRRLSTIVTIFVIIGVTWVMIPNPNQGMTLISINGARMFYTSTALAFGSAGLASLLLSIAGFYLVRGGMAEDMRCGVGSIIAASPIRNSQFLFSRWLAALCFMLCLLTAFLLTMLLCHSLHGDGPIEIAIYLQTYYCLLLPAVCFTVSCAMLFDSIPFLMGKAGDVLFFIFWVVQIGLLGSKTGSDAEHNSLLHLLDFLGLFSSMDQLSSILNTHAISVGFTTYNKSLAGIQMPSEWITPTFVFIRTATIICAMLPLLPAMCLFHRYSADKVKAAKTQSRRNPIAIANQYLRPLTVLCRPLYRLSAMLPGMAGQILADISLSLSISPFSLLAIIILIPAGLLAGLSVLPGVAICAAILWGILICDISTRDFSSAMEEMTGALSGGANLRYLRHLATSVGLGLLLAEFEFGYEIENNAKHILAYLNKHMMSVSPQSTLTMSNCMVNDICS